MKRLVKELILLIVLTICICLYGCGEKTYEVKFVLDGAEHLTVFVADGKCIKDIDTKVDLIQYDLDGWYLDGVKFNEAEPIHSSLVLTGETTDKEYIIVFYNDNGEVLRRKKYSPYEEIEAPSNPKKVSDAYNDYVFDKWDKEFSLAISDMDIKAIYKPTDRYYKVSFLDSDGKQIKEETVKAGGKISDLTCEKAKDNHYEYSFWQWIDEVNNIYDDDKGILKDTKLSPKYHLRPVMNSTEGMTISIVGDSISTHYREGDPFNSYYNGENTFFYPRYSSCLANGSQTWWAQTITKLNAKLGINNSWSGTTCTNNGNSTSASPAENDTRLLTLDEKGTPDIIITYIGTNDCTSGRSKEVFYKGYMNMISKIKKMYPQAYVFCVTLGYSVYDGGSYSDELRLEYNEVIKEICEYYDATVIDWAQIQNEKDYANYQVDRLHLNYNGMTALSNLCVKTIKEYLNIE